MSTHIPLLTVGLPVFNGERYLGGAIECILSQSFRDFEFIISDNASSDGTEEICQHYARRDRRIRYSRNSVNVGGARNSDLILDMARTEFFATASHDDYFSLNYLEGCLAKLQSTTDAVLCCPEQVIFLDPRGNPWKSERNCDTEGREIDGRMHELMNRMGWYAYYGITRTEEFRSLLRDMKRYRYAYGGDVILMATALLRGQIVVAPRTTFFYREPDRAKEFATQMEEILPGSTPPAQPYTGLARDLLQVVQDSELPSEMKSEVCVNMLKTIASQQKWVIALSRENAGGGIGDLAAGLLPAIPVRSRAIGKDAPDQFKSAQGGRESTSYNGLKAEKPHCLRILFQNRPTAKSHPGGDTVVMDLLRRELEQMGHHVDVALGPHDPTGYDLVQAFNFATPDVTEAYARRAVAANVPLVVAAIYEDWPLFLNQSLAMTETLRDYLQGGRDESIFREGVRRVKQLPPAKRADNNYAARNAACLLAWSDSEKARLLSDYPACSVEVISLGADHLASKDVGPALFQTTYGVKDFVLCVGRLETRKNQLMLLKALENDLIPIVFLTGGFSYQPSYAKLCQMFGRQAKTLFLDRVSDEMLVSAYRAARVLCMPSWYELPGLVALEALRLGCPVVASRWGTLPDYVPQGVEYCEPDDPDDIRAAILKSYNERSSVEPHELVRDFQWREAAVRLVAVYEEVLRKNELEALRNKNTVVPHVRKSLAPTFDCSIIMPVCHNVELTKQCLTALSEVTQDIEYEVIVVADVSSNGTQEFLGSLEGDVQIIRNQENIGFTKACNLGARAARGRFLVFLNHDTIPLKNWLTALVAEVTSHPKVGIVGSKLLFEDDTIQHAGVVFSREGLMPYHIYQRLHRDHPAVNQRRTFQSVTAACMLIRREVFEMAGGFDEGFQNGFEDVDLCLKVRDNGWEIVYQPLSVLYHLESQKPWRKTHDQANAIKLLKRWGQRWWLADEDLYYYADGFMSIHTKDGDKEQLELHPIQDDGEKASWRVVVDTERAALRQDIPLIASLLARWDEWPSVADVLHWGAWLCTKIGQAPLSRHFYEKLLQHHDDPAARRALARMALEEGNLSETDAHLTALLKRLPQDGEGWVLRGILEMQQAQYIEAEEAFLNALTYEGDRRRYLMGLGIARVGQDKFEQAWGDFCAVLDEYPDDAEAIHWLLRAGTSRGSWTELSRRIQTFVSRNPADLSVRYAWAGVLIRSGQMDAAQREHQTLCALAPSYEGLDDLARALSMQDTLVEIIPQS